MKKFLIITGLIVFVLGLIAFIFSYSANYSKGYRAGTIMKMSDRGSIFKTHEGQMLMGGLSGANNSDVASGIWDFSVEGKEKKVLEDIEKAVNEGYRVKLFYVEKYFTFFWRGETKYFVYQVEKVGKKETE